MRAWSAATLKTLHSGETLVCKCKQGQLKSVNPATNLVLWLPAVNASQSVLIEVTVRTLPVGYLPTTPYSELQQNHKLINGLVISKEVGHGSTLLIKMAKFRFFGSQQIYLSRLLLRGCPQF